jgi:homopolymeric O-antigen transport system ATP-binding protein
VKPRIELKNVSKVYAAPTKLNGAGTKVAVQPTTLTVHAGERLGIIGPNGAGKSTLLRVIAGLADASSGQIDVEGRVTAIFTLGLGLREDLSGRENIYVDGELQGKSRAEIAQVLDEIIAFADIGEFIGRPVRTYSTGMKSRLAFAMLIHINPEILIIDEALSAGDCLFAAKAYRKMQEICDRGMITIIVSHTMQNVLDLCTRCLWMENGRVVMDGDAAAVTRAYLDAVRTQDEATLAEKLGRPLVTQSFRPGCHVTRLEVRTLERLGNQSMVFSEEDMDVLVGLEAGVPLQNPQVRLRIVRLDGLVVVDSVQGAPIRKEEQGLMGCLGYRIAMRPLVLGAGLYRATIELLDGRDVVAMRSTMLEVVARRSPTGGRPVLLYPCSVSATPIG